MTAFVNGFVLPFLAFLAVEMMFSPNLTTGAKVYGVEAIVFVAFIIAIAAPGKK